MSGQLVRYIYEVNKEYYSVVIDDTEAYTTWKDSEDKSKDEMTFVQDSVFKAKSTALTTDQASTQDLENDFGEILDHKPGEGSQKEFLKDVARHILLNGKSTHKEGLESDDNSRNDARGGMVLDTRGSGSRTSSAR